MVWEDMWRKSMSGGWVDWEKGEEGEEGGVGTSHLILTRKGGAILNVIYQL